MIRFAIKESERRVAFGSFASNHGAACIRALNEGTEFHARSMEVWRAEAERDWDTVQRLYASGPHQIVSEEDYALLVGFLGLVAVVALFRMKDHKESERIQRLFEADAPNLLNKFTRPGTSMQNASAAYVDTLRKVKVHFGQLLIDDIPPTDVSLDLFQLYNRHQAVAGSLFKCFQYNQFRLSRIAQYHGEVLGAARQFERQWS